jgi:diguanylate cyclase (GGDEF)-like protein
MQRPNIDAAPRSPGEAPAPGRPEAARPGLGRLLEAAREGLGMDVACLVRDDRVVEAVAGGDEGLRERLLDALPGQPGDAADLRVIRAAGVGSLVGAPVTLPDGRRHGSLWCASRAPLFSLGEGEARLLGALSRIAAAEIAGDDPDERGARLETETAVQALLAALGAREDYTAAHSRAVVELAEAVARELGLAEPEVTEVGQVALLHDIGKVGVPDSILLNPGRLTSSEWEVMREHPIIGERIVSSLPALAHLAPAVRAEHERWDGRGYPDGLTSEEIPVASRICFVCDAYHAMISDRPYRDALSEAAARERIQRHAGAQFCPATVAALFRVLDSGDHPSRPREATTQVLLPSVAAPEPRVEWELRALIEVSAAVAAAHTFEEVLEVVAEEACKGLRAASVSLNRWDRKRNVVRTLINVGELSPWEERFPEDEVYPLDDFPRSRRLLERGESYTATVEDDSVPADQRMLESLGKGSVLAVPIVFEGETWGEFEAFSPLGAVPFTQANVRFAEAMTAQVSAAIGRAELFSRINALAYEDPLTGLANRRALDEHLESAVASAVESGQELALLFCDLDGLKQINDSGGHEAGDEALRRVAGALRQAASRLSGCFVARLGGDEFCVVLVGHGTDAARRLELHVETLLAADGGPPVSLSAGATSLSEAGPRPADLFRAADAAQYAAKRVGGGRVLVAEQGVPGPDASRPGAGRRRLRDAHPDEPAPLIAAMLEALDGPLAEASAADRVESVVSGFAHAFDAAGWAISVIEPGAGEARIRYSGVRDGDGPALRVRRDGETFSLADFPATEELVRRGGGFFVAVDDPDGDPAERAWLRGRDYRALITAAATGADGSSHLAEIFCDERSGPLQDALPELRLLVGEAAR